MRIIGRWQTTETELWDTDALNLGGPTTIRLRTPGQAPKILPLRIVSAAQKLHGSLMADVGGRRI